MSRAGALRGPLAALLAAVLVSACAGFRPPPPQGSPQAMWQARERALACLETWHMRGRMALAARDEGWSARIDWQQTGKIFQMHLSGPFGWGGFRLTGNDRRFVLTSGDREFRFHARPERVIRQEFGLTVPVRGLRYWVLGLPRPDGATTKKLDDQGRPLRLEQSGWTIQYEEYRRYAGLALPHRIVMERPDLRLKLAVEEWRFDAGQTGRDVCRADAAAEDA